MPWKRLGALDFIVHQTVFSAWRWQMDWLSGCVLQEPTAPVGWEIGRDVVLGKVVEGVIPTHGSNRTPVFESILTELVRLVYEYVWGKNDLLNWMTYG